ncbi:MAG: hypothetical protein AAFN48_08810 [Pseudomonadota bacterium]
MPRYLLTTQTLINLARKQNLAAERWVEGATGRGVFSDDLYISAVTRPRIDLIVQDYLQKIADGTAPEDLTEDYVRRLAENASKLCDIFEAAGRILSANEAVLTRWVSLLNDTKLGRGKGKAFAPLSSIERLEIATAAAGHNGKTYILLGKNEPHLKRINGLQIEDPAARLAAEADAP